MFWNANNVSVADKLFKKYLYLQVFSWYFIPHVPGMLCGCKGRFYFWILQGRYISCSDEALCKHLSKSNWRGLNIIGNISRIFVKKKKLEKSWNFVSPEKWKPCRIIALSLAPCLCSRHDRIGPHPAAPDSTLPTGPKVSFDRAPPHLLVPFHDEIGASGRLTFDWKACFLNKCIFKIVITSWSVSSAVAIMRILSGLYWLS